jgi:hypoxanthine-DNA glycosylase
MAVFIVQATVYRASDFLMSIGFHGPSSLNSTVTLVCAKRQPDKLLIFDNQRGTRMIQSFPPVFSPECSVLILGSMPSPVSLQKGQYYGHERNHFWALMADVLQQPMPQEYEKRTQTLLLCGVGLWDVIRSCERQGALDRDIRNEQPNDIADLIEHSRVQLLAFNGTKAQSVYERHIVLPRAVDTLLLPSSSPIPRRHIKSLQDKLPMWRKIRDYLV